MNRFLLFLFLFSLTITPIYAIVDFGGHFAIPYDDGPACLGNQYFEVGFHTNFELNNGQFQIQRSTDPNFSWAITGTSGFNGNIDGCGTCSGRTYSVLDYGPFAPGEEWYYRIKATSNSLNVTYHEFGSPVIINMPTIVDWSSQVSHILNVGSSPSTELSYVWGQEPTRVMQGVSVSLMPTEIFNLYLEQNNHKINFNSQTTTPFYNLEVNVNNAGYLPIYTGSGVTNYIWENSSGYFNQIGGYNLKVRFTNSGGTIFYREYNVHVVPKADELHVDNYCNMMRVWKSSNPNGGIPIVFSEGFDAYNLRTQQFYMHAGKDLASCLLDKGFDVYIINYYLNSQSLKNNAAVYQSAVRYVSSINSNQDVIAMGMSMGGVICRYASAKAEHDGIPLPISKFVSLDAPHQGAVISKEFQDWRKQQFDNNPDLFGEYNLDNPATKELLLYSAWDPNALIHDDFYNTLNSLNGDGYPHLVESIGVSFSNNTPNSNSGQWLAIDISGIPFYDANESFDLSEEEKLAGSYLPLLNIDPSPIFSKSTGFSFLLSVLRPFSDPSVSVNQTANPTFIPHESALDIVAGQSMFDQVITPNSTGFHDQIPPDIIQPLVNALLKDVVYVQNIDYFDTKTVIAGEYIFAGNSVTLSEPIGDVNVHSGADITFKAGTDVVIEAGFNVLPGGVYNAVIDGVDCNGEVEHQNKSIEQNITKINYNLIRYEDDLASNYSTLERKSDNLKSQGFEIYPNPANDFVKVEFHLEMDDNNLVFELRDMTGRMVQENKLNDSLTNSFQIDLSSLSSGFYMITMKIGTEAISKQILVKR